MKTAPLWALLALATLPACSSLATTFDYDTAYDFVGLRTYGWIDKQEITSDMKGVRDAVDAAMLARGLELTAIDPDFQIAAFVSGHRNLRVVDWGYTFDPSDHWHRGSGFEGSQYKPGTLVLDVVDPRRNSLVWRGAAAKTADPSWTPEQRDAEARAAVNALLAKFPPKN